MRFVTTCVLAAWLGLGCASAARAQEEVSAPCPTGAPLILSVEGATARLSVMRLRRALSAVLGRPMLRMTDGGANEAAGTLSLAFVAPRSWVIRLDAGATHTSRTIEVRGPALETLVGVAVDLIRSLPDDAAPPVATSVPASSVPASSVPPRSLVVEPWADPRVVISSEILDPFAGMPVTRVSIAAVSELLDPFAAVGSSVRVARSPEVLDPWR